MSMGRPAERADGLARPVRDAHRHHQSRSRAASSAVSAVDIGEAVLRDFVTLWQPFFVVSRGRRAAVRRSILLALLEPSRHGESKYHQ